MHDYGYGMPNRIITGDPADGYPHLLFKEHDFAIYNWIADNDHHLFGKIPYDKEAKSLICSGGVQKYGYTAPSIHLLLSWIEILREV